MRVRSESWLSDLLSAATKVFSVKGYRQAQMSDIAREMGVSQGTLYNYVDSKEALFMLVCERGFSNRPVKPPKEPPVASPSFDAMLQQIRERTRSFRLETLAAALRTDKPADARAELEGMLREFYAVIERSRHGFDLVERSALDVPELAQMVFIEGRRAIVAAFARYLTSRIKAGYFKPVPDAATAARFIVEATAWFARHRHHSPDSQMITEQNALETTIHFLVSALIPEDRSETGKRRRRGRTAKESLAQAPSRQFGQRH